MFMFKKGDIVDFFDKCNWELAMPFSITGNLFIVKGIEKYRGNELLIFNTQYFGGTYAQHPKYGSCSASVKRFRLVARKTKFGYIYVNG